LIPGEGGFWAVCSHELHSIRLRAAAHVIPATDEAGVEAVEVEGDVVDSGDGRLR